MINILEKIRQRTLIDTCHVCLPYFSFAYAKDPVSVVHRHALNPDGRQRSALKIAFFTAYWPLRAIVLAISATPKLDSKLHGVDMSRGAIFWMFWYLMIRHNMSIESCFRFRMWDRHNRRRAPDYLQRYEHYALLNWLSRNKDTQPLIDKAAFEDMCRKQNLPCANIVATATDQGVVMLDGPHLPKKDLFSKFNEQSCGSGGQAWNYKEPSQTWSNDQQSFTEPQLLKYFKEMAKGETILIQLKLRNAETLKKFSSGALCSIRVVTYKLPGQASKHLRSSLRMPVGQVDIDNFAAGGIAANIDASGYLTTAMEKFGSYRFFDVHPYTNTPITGTMLENFNDAPALAMRSHDLLTDICFVGWDIAYTQHGLMVIEGNVTWDQAVIQMPASEPLGKDFCELYLAAKEASEATP